MIGKTVSGANDGGNCSGTDTLVVTNFKTADSGQLTIWSMSGGSGKFSTPQCSSTTSTASLSGDWSDFSKNPNSACPGISQTGIKCSTIPLGCPGSSQQGPVSTTVTLKCPYAPTDASWKCPAKECDFASTSTTVKSGQTYQAATAAKCPSGSTTNTDGTCGCPDGSVVQPGDACSSTSSTTCGGGSWDWAICPTDTLFQTVAQKLLDFMQSLLDINTTGPNGIFNTSDSSGNGAAYYHAWNSFRILGTAVVVIAGLVMVSSQALGFEVFDAYTIRKVLPRLLIAIIAMSLSWPLLAFVIGFFNTLGRDIQGIMYAPFQTLPNHAGLSDGIISWGFIGVIALAAAAGYGAVLLPILGTGALALLLAILILIVRQIGVTILVITAPLAIACYVLPNTKKVWDLWKDNFLGLMVMYPIVMMFIAAGEIFGAVGKSGGTVQQIVGIVAFFVPFFLIPLAFRMATGMISTLTGIVNDRSKGGFDRLRNARQNMTQKQTENLRNNNAWKNAPKGSIRSKLNKGLFMAGNVNQAGLRPSQMRQNMHGFESRHSINAARKMLEEDEAMKMFSGNEDYTNAYLDSGGDENKMRAILAKGGYDNETISQAISQVRHSRRGVSEDVFNKAAVLSLPGTGTAAKTVFDDNGNVVSGGGGEIKRRINEVWGDDRVGATSALVAARGAFAQARRFDAAGGGTADDIRTMNAQYAYQEAVKKNPGMTITEANTPDAFLDVTDEAGNTRRVLMDEKGATEKTIRESLKGQGGSYINGTKTTGVTAFSTIMKTDIKAQSQRDQDQVTVDPKTKQVTGTQWDQTVRQYTNLAGRYDGMAGAPPDAVDQLEKTMADKVTLTDSFAQHLNAAYHAANPPKPPKPGEAPEPIVDPYAAGQEYTNRQITEFMRDIPGFLDRRRELGRGVAANGAALAAQQQAVAGPQGQNPTAGPLGGAIPPVL
jgi:hypothetical protein